MLLSRLDCGWIPANILMSVKSTSVKHRIIKVIFIAKAGILQQKTYLNSHTSVVLIALVLV